LLYHAELQRRIITKIMTQNKCCANIRFKARWRYFKSRIMKYAQLNQVIGIPNAKG
jgi:hypothetical protein